MAQPDSKDPEGAEVTKQDLIFLTLDATTTNFIEMSETYERMVN